ncbi:MAG: Kae1-associated kinase Bud32 [Sulfolobaceae archaeon]
MEIKRVIARGAEAIIYEGYFLGIHSIFKKRLVKNYRNNELDKLINSQRTVLEAKLMFSALKNGINVPAILYVDKDNYLIVMEYIEGEVVREILTRDSTSLDIGKLGEWIGSIAGKLHSIGIVHGDFTTNNLILSQDGELFLIDFGLAKRSDKIEDMATDVHVFLRSLESVHYKIKDYIFENFIKGYKTVNPRVNEVLKKMREIRLRGRYVSERKKSLLRNNES